jgi:hypothetical protein
MRHKTAAVSTPKPDEGSLELTEELIRVRAYRFHEERGCEQGHHMPDDPPRFLCPVRTSKEIIMYTCGRCAWTLRVEGDDLTTGQAAFDAHRCEDFPRIEGF